MAKQTASAASADGGRRRDGAGLGPKRVFEGVQAVKESTTYQAIVEEGQIKEARKLILRHGKRKFGRPTAAVARALEGTEDLDRLERLSDRLLTAASWTELLDAE